MLLHASFMPALSAIGLLKCFTILLITKLGPGDDPNDPTPSKSEFGPAFSDRTYLTYKIKVKGSGNARVFEDICRRNKLRVKSLGRKWWQLKYRYEIYGPMTNVINLIADLRKQFT